MSVLNFVHFRVYMYFGHTCMTYIFSEIIEVFYKHNETITFAAKVVPNMFSERNVGEIVKLSTFYNTFLYNIENKFAENAGKKHENFGNFYNLLRFRKYFR